MINFDIDKDWRKQIRMRPARPDECVLVDPDRKDAFMLFAYIPEFFDVFSDRIILPKNDPMPREEMLKAAIEYFEQAIEIRNAWKHEIEIRHVTPEEYESAFSDIPAFYRPAPENAFAASVHIPEFDADASVMISAANEKNAYWNALTSFEKLAWNEYQKNDEQAAAKWNQICEECEVMS